MITTGWVGGWADGWAEGNSDERTNLSSRDTMPAPNTLHNNNNNTYMHNYTLTTNGFSTNLCPGALPLDPAGASPQTPYSRASRSFFKTQNQLPKIVTFSTMCCYFAAQFYKILDFYFPFPRPVVPENTKKNDTHPPPCVPQPVRRKK